MTTPTPAAPRVPSIAEVERELRALTFVVADGESRRVLHRALATSSAVRPLLEKLDATDLETTRYALLNPRQRATLTDLLAGEKGKGCDDLRAAAERPGWTP